MSCILQVIGRVVLFHEHLLRGTLFDALKARKLVFRTLQGLATILRFFKSESEGVFFFLLLLCLLFRATQFLLLLSALRLAFLLDRVFIIANVIVINGS